MIKANLVKNNLENRYLNRKNNKKALIKDLLSEKHPPISPERIFMKLPTLAFNPNLFINPKAPKILNKKLSNIGSPDTKIRKIQAE